MIQKNSFLLFVFLASSLLTMAQVKPDPCQIENYAFKGYESLTYKIYYHLNFVWVPAGEVSFRVFDEGDQYHMIVDGRTYKSYEIFYKVHHHYETFVDKKTLLPSLFIKKTQEGKSTRYSRLEFNRRENTVKNYRGKTEEEAKITTQEINSCLHDFISIIYFLRNIDSSNFVAGNELPVNIFYGKEELPVFMYFHQKEEKKIRGQGKYNTIKFSPRLATGGLLENDDMFIWASDDANRMPLLIESPLSTGTVRAVLKEYRGLKHAPTAWVK